MLTSRVLWHMIMNPAGKRRNGVSVYNHISENYILQCIPDHLGLLVTERNIC